MEGKVKMNKTHTCNESLISLEMRFMLSQGQKGSSDHASFLKGVSGTSSGTQLPAEFSTQYISLIHVTLYAKTSE
ncbi:hypothetical protein DPMN_091102 [Dreissena polymorpha]|uniref:Uncharacterized protein n=1 Tax=Dreissena polymorpha TaxID=45954 RepID=A0A9D4KYZ5_DREPO|nr:hypothetical protein DPMN_091102 [Dreissena polymorpha]